MKTHFKSNLCHHWIAGARWDRN